MEYGIIFITAEEVEISGEVYNYNDQILVNEFDNSQISLLWQGQKKGGRDYIVVGGDREIHVCGRRRKGDHYKYYGVVDRPSMRRVFEGDHQQRPGIPDSYYMNLRAGRCPVRTLLTGNLSPQAQAVQSLGFRHTAACCGIYEVWPLIEN